MRRFVTRAIIAILMLQLGCKNVNSKREVSLEMNIPKLELNDGQKWKANEATTDTINKMIKILDSVSVKHKEISIVAQLLDDKFKTIVSKCTMKGEAHEQLHYYLIPLKEKINDLKAYRGDKVERSIRDIQMYLLEYQKYFE